LVKLIIFDWDDVFTLGSKEGYFACYDRAFEAVGFRLPHNVERKRILANWGKPFREVFKVLLKEHPKLIDKAYEAYDKAYWADTFVKELKVLPGTIDLLNRMHQKYILAIATGNRYEMLHEHIFPRFNFPDVFSQIVSSHDIENPEMTKPHPHMLEIIMKKQQVKAEETIFVGDAWSDVQMALNAHVTPVVVLTGHLSKQKAEKLGVSYIIPDVRDLETVLDKLN
jgi:HAD superfamily hydrolase (TIGR01549 family)